MAEEVGIVMTLYDRVSLTWKAIAGNNRAFDKTLDELEESLRANGTAQDARRGLAAESENDCKGSVKSIDIPGGSV